MSEQDVDGDREKEDVAADQTDVEGDATTGNEMSGEESVDDGRTSWLGHIARLFIRFCVRRYYPRIEISNRERIPKTGPVLLCANHPNSLIDPVLIGIASERAVRFLAKEPLFSVPIIGRIMYALGMIPAFRGQDDARQVRRNVESLNTGSQVLVEGSALGIFPEGRSSDETQVGMVRSGAARMAMKAAADGAEGLQIIMVGLNYEQKERFRSSVWVQVGEPIDAAEWLKQHDNNERKAMRALTPELEARLKQVVVHLDETKWEPFLEDLDILVPGPREARQTTAGPVRQRKRIADAMNHFLATDRERTEAAATDIAAWRYGVEAIGIRPDSVVLQRHGFLVGLTLLWQFLWLLLLCVPAILGSLFHIVPFVFVRTAASRLDQPGRVTVSTHRLMISLPAYLIWYVAMGSWLLTDFAAWFAWTTLIAMPAAGIFALHYWRQARRAFGLVWHQVQAILNRDQLRQLQQQQSGLRETLEGLAREYADVAPREETPAKPSWLRILRPIGAWALFFAVVFGVGWIGWKLLLDKPLQGKGLNLAGMSDAALSRNLQSDERSLEHIIQGLDELEADARNVQAEFGIGKRTYENQGDNDDVRELMRRYLGYQEALLRLLWKYQRHGDVKTDELKLRAFLVHFASAVALYDSALKFVEDFGRGSQTIAKLNEAEPNWGIPPNLYDSIRAALASRRNNRMLEAADQYYLALRKVEAFEKHQLLKEQPHSQFHQAILAHSEFGKIESVEVAADELIDLIKLAHYRSHSAVSTWIGDFRIREPHEGHTLIDPQQLADLRTKLEPGDILLERRNWYLSNAFLPGYWPHAALYVGTAEDLKERGLDRNEFVRRHWDEFTQRDHDGHEHVIIEAVSEGVVFSTLEHSIGGGDSVAVLRPNLTPEQKNEAITAAFSFAKRPYDFEFDFSTTDKLVCTEVVFRSYGGNSGELRFPVVSILGRPTMPAINLVQKFADEREQDDAQLEFVAFIDGDITTGTSTVGDEKAFIATLDLPGLTWWSSAKKRPLRTAEDFGRVALVLLVYFVICAAVYKRREDPAGDDAVAEESE